MTGGGPGQWETGLGFKIPVIGEPTPFVDEDVDNVTIKHVEIDVGSIGPDTNRAVELQQQNNWNMSHLWIHDVGCDVFSIAYGLDNLTLEYSKIARNYQSSTGCHGDLFESQAGTFNNWIMRWNYFEDIVGSYLFGNHGTSISGYEIYGNVLHFKNKGPGLGNGVVGVLSGGGSITNLKFYNNTISGIFDSSTQGFYGDLRGVNNVGYNNIWHEGTDSGYSFSYGTATHGFNTHYNMPTQSGEENYNGNPFANSLTGDFNLTGTTDVGIVLPAPYNKDAFGNTRGSDSVWDRGAYEFVSGASDLTPPSAPTGVSVQ